MGKTQYVQMVNEGLQVFDKVTGASVFGPVAIGSIWSGFGGACQSGSGDPIVVYDQLADRWIISQFAAAKRRHCAARRVYRRYLRPVTPLARGIGSTLSPDQQLS